MPNDTAPVHNNAMLYAPPADPVWLVMVTPNGVVTVNPGLREEDWQRTKERAPDVYTVARVLAGLS